MKYYLVGVKGAGVSALALILKDLGHEVWGYDDEVKHQFTEDKLIAAGIKIYNEDNDVLEENVIVIRSTAINPEVHPQIVKAQKLGLKIYEYMEFLGELTKEHFTIAISGTHGKTTTTSMLKEVINPILGCNYLVGDGNGYAKKGNKYLLIEACEFRRNFLHYLPKISIITNVDLDHVNYYKDIDDVKSAFTDFANKTEELVIIYGDDENARSLDFGTPRINYGLKADNDVCAKNIIYGEDGINFDVYLNQEFYHHFVLPFYGEHLLLNSLAVITLCNYLKLDVIDIQNYLAEFKGADRRFSETIIGNAIVIDDYAHHPNEIAMTIKAAKQKYPHQRVIAVFEPHTFSRTKMFYGEMAEALNLADEAYVLDIYNPRDNPADFIGITSALIVDKLNNGHHLARSSEDLFKHKEDVILFMSPKEIADVKANLINYLKTGV